MSEDAVVDKAVANKFFKYVRMQSNNKRCADCSSPSPIWASVTFGVFVCTECAAKHRELGVGISKVKSTILDTWSLGELRRVYVSGNGAAAKLGRASDLRAKYSGAGWYAKEVGQQCRRSEEDEPGASFIEGASRRSERAVEPRQIEEKRMPRFADSEARYAEEKSTAQEKGPEEHKAPGTGADRPAAIKRNLFPSLRIPQKGGFNVEGSEAGARKLGFGALHLASGEDSGSSEKREAPGM